MSETTNQPTAPESSDKTKQPDKVKTVNVKKDVKKKPKTAVDELTAEEREAVTIVFHQFETGLREGTIYTKVIRYLIIGSVSNSGDVPQFVVFEFLHCSDGDGPSPEGIVHF